MHRTSKGRECLFPEVSRTFHNGARGTFMNPMLHSQFFAKIAYSTDPAITWPRSEWEPLKTALSKEAYERRLREALRRATPLSDLTELFEHGRHEQAQRGGGGGGGGSGGGGGGGGGSRSDDGEGGNAHAVTTARVRDVEADVVVPVLALWYSLPPRSSSSSLFKEIAILLGMWHEMRRGSHYGVHEIRCREATLFVVNLLHGPDAKESPYADLAPTEDSKVFRTSAALKKAVRHGFRHLPGKSRTAVCRTNAER